MSVIRSKTVEINNELLRPCAICKLLLPLDHFYKIKARHGPYTVNSHHPYCRKCKANDQRRRRKLDKLNESKQRT